MFMLNERQDRFQRIATNRTNKILDMLRLLGNCSNTVNYEYTEDEVKQIFSAIEAEVKIQKAKFTTSKPNRKFTLNRGN